MLAWRRRCSRSGGVASVDLEHEALDGVEERGRRTEHRPRSGLAAVETAQSTPGFAGDQCTGCDVPRAEVLLEVDVDAARGERAQVGGSGPHPTQVAHAGQQLGYPRGDIDLAINATSLGLSPTDPPPWDAKQFSLRQAHNIYDMIYRPAETALLKAAKAGGSRVSNGVGMLLYQGAAAFELWTGQRAPVEVMRRALETTIYGG